MRFIRSMAAAALCLGAAAPAGAVVFIEAAEVDGAVVFSGSGSIDLTGLGAPASAQNLAFIAPASGSAGFGPAVPVPSAFYGGAVASVPAFGVAGAPVSTADSGVGGVFGFGSVGVLSLPAGYISGARLSFSSVWENASFASLGIEAGRYEYPLLNGETIRLNISREVAFTIRIDEVGGDVLLTGAGALDLTGLGDPEPNGLRAGIRPDAPEFALGPAEFLAADFYAGAVIAPPAFGFGAPQLTVADSGSGDRFGVVGPGE